MVELRGSLGVTLLVLAASASAADLSIAFVHPETYTDASYSHAMASERDRAVVQHDIEQHLRLLAQRKLAPGDALKIEVLDIDLAGHFRVGSDLRIVGDVTWPRMNLRYTLTRGDQVIAAAEERISDMNYLMPGNRYSSSDRLRYEKAMLDDWFDKKIAKR